MLLLSGPPGLGKTTLAKIVAKHAGYDTVEVNASDSRTIGDFEKILEGAVRSSRTINKVSGLKHYLHYADWKRKTDLFNNR